MNDEDLQEYVDHLQNQSKKLELTTVVDFFSGETLTWLELWVIYGVDRDVEE